MKEKYPEAFDTNRSLCMDMANRLIDILLNKGEISIDKRLLNRNLFSKMLIRILLENKIISPMRCYLLENNIRVDTLDKWYLSMLITKKRQISDMKIIVNKFVEESIEYLIIKGIPQEIQLYGSILLRDVGDIDIVVKPEFFKKAYEILYSLGYRQNDNTSSTTPQKVASVYYWEISMYDATKTYVIELKIASSAVRKNFGELFNYKHKIEIDKFEVYTLNHVGTLLHTLSNMHEENVGRQSINTKLRNDIEAYVALCKYGGDLDLIELSEKLEVRHKIYEVIKRLDAIFGLSEAQLDFGENFHIKYCNYKHELDGWSDTPEWRNGALLFEEDKTYSSNFFMDGNNSFGEFMKLFKNTCYLNRNFTADRFCIRKGDISGSVAYRGYSGCTYNFKISQEYTLTLYVKMRFKDIAELQQLIISLSWYESDLARKNLETCVYVNLSELLEYKHIDLEYTGLLMYKDEEIVKSIQETWEIYNKNSAISLISTNENIAKIEIVLDLDKTFFNGVQNRLVGEFCILDSIQTGKFNLGMQTYDITITNLPEEIL